MRIQYYEIEKYWTELVYFKTIRAGQVGVALLVEHHLFNS